MIKFFINSNSITQAHSGAMKNDRGIMNKSIAAKSIVYFLCIVLVNGCGPAFLEIHPTLPALPTDAPAPTNTATPVPTNTSIPTITPVPTNTPIPPTATVRPPENSFKYLDGVQVVYVEKFENSSTDGWILDAGTIENGALEVASNNWNGPVRVRNFNELQGVIVDFTFSKGSVIEMFMNTGKWKTATYKRFGFYVEYSVPKINIWSGPYFVGGSLISGNLKLKPETLYTALLVLLPDGGFFCTIWDAQDPSKSLQYRVEKGKNWSELPWLFKFGVKRGMMVVNNYREITFDSFIK